MRKVFKKRKMSSMIQGVISCCMIVAPIVMAQDEDSIVEVIPRIVRNDEVVLLHEVVYNDVPHSFFADVTGELRGAAEVLEEYGIKFEKGASVQYIFTTKKLTMANTKEQHELLAKVLADYKKKNRLSKTPTHSADVLYGNGKLISGKINKKAKIYVNFMVSEQDLENADAAQYNPHLFYNGDKEAYETWLDVMKTLSKSKRVQVVLIIQKGCDHDRVKKFTKMLKLNSPVLEYSPKNIQRIAEVYSDKVFGLERPNISCTIESKSCWNDIDMLKRLMTYTGMSCN